MHRPALALILLAAAPSPQEPANLLGEIPIRTRFAEQGLAALPRSEHPRPLLVRPKWLSLNGAWRFSRAASGEFRETIRVPFAPESVLSGIGCKQEILERCRYRRTFTVPPDWHGARIVLRFEAVDWEAKVRVDGKQVGEHRGGYDAFAFDVTDALAQGPEHTLEVDVHDPADPAKGGWQPRGKQLGSHGIWYTRTTGIWRSVWLEAMPPVGIERLRIRTRHTGELEVLPLWRSLGALPVGATFAVAVRGPSGKGAPLVHEARVAVGPDPLRTRLVDVVPWSPANPALYELEVTVRDAKGMEFDRASSYAAFRTVDVEGGVFRCNGVPFFYRGVLDQGYWPESGLTAPSDAALEFDVKSTKELGFDLARKHVKVEDARWYHWCDRLGVLVMQDMPSSMDLAGPDARDNFLRELAAMVGQLESHPSVVHWVVFNEDWGKPGAFQDEGVRLVRGLDPTRPVTDASGWTQREDTDFTDVHDYGANLARHGSSTPPKRALVIGECGGIAFSHDGHRWTPGWGYTSAATAGSFVRRIARLTEQVQATRHVSGFVWTQLTDVEQELNGVLHYDRTDKVDRAALRRAIRAEVPAATRTAPDAWQVVGPLPAGTRIATPENSEANRAALTKALAAEFGAKEALLDGATGLEHAGTRHAWVRVVPSAFAVDLASVFGGGENCVAYARGTFRVAERTKVRLEFGSDDAARVWLDGRQVLERVAVRGVSLGDDEVEGIVLEPGEHTVLVKVAQGVYGFGFALCFAHE